MKRLATLTLGAVLTLNTAQATPPPRNMNPAEAREHCATLLAMVKNAIRIYDYLDCSQGQCPELRDLRILENRYQGCMQDPANYRFYLR